MKLYGRYFRKYKVPFLAAVMCVTLEAVCDLMGPTLMAHIINTGIERAALEKVYYWGFWMLVVTALGACFAITRNQLASYVSQRMGGDLRVDLFKKIMCFSEESTDQIESGSLITRMTNDTSQIVQFVNGAMRIFLKAPITCIGSIILASLLNIRLSFMIYGVVTIVTTLIYTSMKFSYPRFYQLQKAMDQVNTKIQEYLIGIRLVKSFGTYEKEMNKFQESNANLMNKGLASQMIITTISPILTLVVGMGTVAVIYLGSRLYPIELADTGDITAFIIYMSQILTSLIMITNVFTMFVRTKASTMRIIEVLTCKEDFKKSGISPHLNGEIVFDHVTFSYPNGSGIPALQDLSFSIEKGQTLAIIGATGSGKSTIAWLLLRFYDVDKGKIMLDQVDIKEIGPDVIRQNIAVVPQSPMLFSGTVRDNLKWGNEYATRDNMEEAVEKAEASFLYDMDNGYDSILGNSGVNLSGGQKQRISLARGLLKEAPILLLDDATSALDAMTEAKIIRNIYQSKGTLTTLLITQRCGTAMFADKILVLENGRKIGMGSHEELMKVCEVYKDIYNTQMESKKEGA